MKRRLLLFLTFLSLMAGFVSARTVQGTVVEALTNEPIMGASVRVKSDPKIGTTTNLDGKFTLNVPDKATTLVITYIGMQSEEVKISDNMTVKMTEVSSNLDEVVVVGYSTSTKRDLISSVSTVKTDQIVNLPVTNIVQGLAGRSPGLIIQASGGGINSRPSVSIRGGGTPLYVIDGIIRSEDDFANLSPDDIKDVSILKDASATAVYGSRAANGIIQVTTRSGSQGKAVIEYDFNASWSQPSIWPKKLPAWERAYWGNQARFNDGYEEGYYSEEAMQAMKYVKALREAGIPAELYPDAAKLKKQMAMADCDRIPYVAFVGESELGRDSIVVKDMITGEQQVLTLSRTIELLKQE